MALDKRERAMPELAVAYRMAHAFHASQNPKVKPPATHPGGPVFYPVAARRRPQHPKPDA